MASLASSTKTLAKDAEAENHNSSIFFGKGSDNLTDEEIINNIQVADTEAKLVNAFKRVFLQPQLTKAALLQVAKEKKKEVSGDVWTKNVAKVFGSALKAAKISESLTDRFVEVFHPEWKRWRCAKVLSRINSIRKKGDSSDTDSSNEKEKQDNRKKAQACDDCAPNVSMSTGNSEDARNGKTAEVVESLEVQFFDGDKVYKVYSNDTKDLPYTALPMLMAASEGNITRLVALIENSSDNVILIRTGCSLLISLTVGNSSRIDSHVDRNRMLSETNCIEVACTLLADRKQHTDDGDTVESVLRVLLNLACSEYNIPRICMANGVELIVSAMETFENHSGVQYAGAKTVHNMAIDNAEVANKCRTLGIEQLISNAMSRFTTYKALQHWGDMSLNVVRRFATIVI